ncbi:MAG: DNA-binding protein [Methanocellales archaeon]|nr:DNA-binding protein [Methanocellales archaeon]MDD4898627.1 DNA-binding protein [Methanocellales archaeon]MDD5447293.1 DNA-binding protein [Methanocellales archaeon]
MMDDELDEIRRRKLEEFKQEQMRVAQDEAAKEELQAKKQSILRAILTTKARERLNSIRTTKPSFADQVELQLIALVQSGQIRQQIDDNQLKRILLMLQPKKKDVTIRRI